MHMWKHIKHIYNLYIYLYLHLVCTCITHVTMYCTYNIYIYAVIQCYMMLYDAANRKICCCPKQELSCARNHHYHAHTVDVFFLVVWSMYMCICHESNLCQPNLENEPSITGGFSTSRLVLSEGKENHMDVRTVPYERS